MSACILHGWNCIVEISASAAFYSLGPCLGRERGGPQPSQTEPWKLGSRLNHLTAGLSQRQGDQPRVRILTPQKPPRWPLASHSGEQEALLHHFLECQRKSPEKVDSLPPRRHSHGDNQPDACLPRHCSQFSVFSTALAKKEKKKKTCSLSFLQTQHFLENPHSIYCLLSGWLTISHKRLQPGSRFLVNLTKCLHEGMLCISHSRCLLFQRKGR